jgi:type VI secretion system secreted protein Hcp
MAADYLLIIDGIKGECLEPKDAIELDSFAWGMSQSGAAHRGSGLGSAKVDVSDLTIHKHVDKSSPLLQQACANGKHITKAKLVARKAGENALDYLIIDLEGVLVSGYTINGNGAGGGNYPIEDVTLNFAKVKCEYWTQGEKGAKGENANFGWDVSKNTKY